MDVMVLGRDPVGEVNSIHFTSQGGEATSTVMVPQESTPTLPRGQALAWVNGSVLHIAGRQSTLGPPYFWEIEAHEMVETAPRTGSRLLSNHDIWIDNVISLATGDLDYDGSDEAVVATRSAASEHGDASTMISVLDFGLGATLAITRLVTTEIITSFIDISAEILDLDGNGKQDEIIVIAYEDPVGVHSYVYRYDPGTQQIMEMSQGILLSDDGLYEVEVSAGRLHPPDPDNDDPRMRYLGEQVIVESTYIYGTIGWRFLHSTLQIFTISDTMELQESNIYNFDFVCSDCRSRYRSTVDAGDIDGDGYDEIAVWAGKNVSIVDPISGHVETVTYDPVHDPNNGLGQSLSVGDIDLDGRAEICRNTTLSAHL
jgi:hypothetical protein